MRFSHFIAIRNFLHTSIGKRRSYDVTIHVLQAQDEFFILQDYPVRTNEMFCVDTYSLSVLSIHEVPATHIAAYRYNKQLQRFIKM